MYGVEHFSEGSKGNIAVKYFRELFLSSNPSHMDELFEGLQSKVTLDMNVMLTHPISGEEIKCVAFGVKGSSARVKMA